MSKHDLKDLLSPGIGGLIFRGYTDDEIMEKFSEHVKAELSEPELRSLIQDRRALEEGRRS